MSHPQRRWTEDEVARHLEAVRSETALDSPEPPEDLLEQIQAEIPADLFPVENEVWIRPQRRSRYRQWLAAAAVAALAVTGGWLALRVGEQAAPKEDFLVPTPSPEPVRGRDADPVTESVSSRSESVADGDAKDQPAKATQEMRHVSPPAAGRRAPEGSDEDDASDLVYGVPGADPTPDELTVVEKSAGNEFSGSISYRDAVDPSQAPAEAEAGYMRNDPQDSRDQGAARPPAQMAAEYSQENAEVSRLQRQEREVREELRKLEKSRSRAFQSPPPPPPAPRPATSGEIPKVRAEGQVADVNRQLMEAEAPARRIPTPSSSAPTVGTTGGNAEPNDQPYGDVFFESAGTNPFIDTEDDDRSTFGFDVDTGSYTVVRRYLSDGHLPPHDAVRVEEMINFFDYGDAPPRRGDFALHAEGAPSPFAHGPRYQLLRFAVAGRVVDTRDRKPALLTFVVDVSGSMSMENRLGLVKRSLGMLLDQLRPDDQVALVVFGSAGRVVLPPTSDKYAIREAIDRLQTEGATNAEEGLRLGYDIAARNARRGILNRVILCSDGVANVGATGPDSILARIQRETEQGIELTTLGFGMGNYNDVLMEQLADRGNGRYAYIDSLDEAHRILVEELTGTLQTIASEARAQVVFNPKVVERYRLIGYENRDIADHRFRDDTVDAGEIGAGHHVTALYEVKLAEGYEPGDGRADVATLYVRYRSHESERFEEVDRRVTLADFHDRWNRASRALRLTSLVAEFGEILKGSYWAKQGNLHDVFRRTQAVSSEFAGDRDVADLVSLMGRAADLQDRSERPDPSGRSPDRGRGRGGE